MELDLFDARAAHYNFAVSGKGLSTTPLGNPYNGLIAQRCESLF
jgi:hypothetical protein